MSYDYKVIATSNFNDETFCESQTIGPCLTESQAKRIAAILNEGDPNSRTYYRAAEKDRKLWRGMADLVGDYDEPFEPTHRHFKTGGLYRVTGEGRLEVTGNHAFALTEYENAKGERFAQWTDRFNDGRFEVLP